MENLLEELYELLDLYFSIIIPGGIIRPYKNYTDVEPQLDYYIFKEKTLSKILELSQRLHSL